MNKLAPSKGACLILLLCAATVITSPAQTFTTLVNFDGANGANPGGGQFTQGTDGNLYGGVGGGANGSGLLFKLTPTGTFTVLYNFCSEPGCADGANGGGLVLATNGDFYGSTSSGGAFGYGTIFKLAGEDAPTTIFNFDDTDGAGFTHLTQGTSGALYGTASYGGNLAECYGPGCGTAFKISPEGENFTLLHTFCTLPDCADGAVLYGALAQGNNGDFYGAAWGGGGPSDGGTIFTLTSNGTLTTLHSFCEDYPACNDGSNPISVVLGKDGNFYGATYGGGNYTQGSVFKITPGGALTTLYNFCTQTGCTDGSAPRNGLTLGSDGNFYGTTYYGGAHNEGTVFKVTPQGELTTLHSFDGTDGNYPIGGLVQATNGAFYGTTSVGGSGGDGTIFTLATGLRPFIETIPTSGKVGASVIILGNNLIGTTNVTFNGTPTNFTVVSSSEIVAAVPPATSGEVRVTTPSGALLSNLAFAVR